MPIRQDPADPRIDPIEYPHPPDDNSPADPLDDDLPPDLSALSPSEPDESGEPGEPHSHAQPLDLILWSHRTKAVRILGAQTQTGLARTLRLASRGLVANWEAATRLPTSAHRAALSRLAASHHHPLDSIRTREDLWELAEGLLIDPKTAIEHLRIIERIFPSELRQKNRQDDRSPVEISYWSQLVRIIHITLQSDMRLTTRQLQSPSGSIRNWLHGLCAPNPIARKKILQAAEDLGIDPDVPPIQVFLQNMLRITYQLYPHLLDPISQHSGIPTYTLTAKLLQADFRDFTLPQLHSLTIAILDVAMRAGENVASITFDPSTPMPAQTRSERGVHSPKTTQGHFDYYVNTQEQQGLHPALDDISDVFASSSETPPPEDLTGDRILEDFLNELGEEGEGEGEGEG
jgi:hypothetical protein